MKQPTLSQFNHKLNDLISNIPMEKLKKIILAVAGETRPEDRTGFLQKVEQVISGIGPQPVRTKKPELTPADLFKKIDDYTERMKNGEFYDEERDYREYQRDKYSYYRNGYDYYADDADFSDEEYVLEMEGLLDGAQSFYRQGDIDTALKAYQSIFNIIDDESSVYDEYFFYGFSFGKALGENNYKNHKVLFLRSFYLYHLEINRSGIFHLLSKQHSLYLSDIADAESEPLPGFERFTDAYIQYLSKQAGKARHLVDAVFVKGGMEELKRFAYQKGGEIPALFLSCFDEMKQRNASSDEIQKLALDGIRIIPERYASRSLLSKELIQHAKRTGDEDLLLKAYSTAFYSNPSLANMDAYLGLIRQQSIHEEIKKVAVYLESKTYLFTKKEKLFDCLVYFSRIG